MKKFLAALTAFIFLFLSACSDNGGTKQTPSDAPTAALTTEVQYVTSWGTDLLPDNFPAPPATMSMYSHSLDEHEELFYPNGAQVLTLTFNCTKPDFTIFSNSLKEAGYKGGFAHVENGEYYYDGFYGGWQDGETIIIISGSVELNSLEYTYILEVSKCADYFPTGFDGLFPKFEGYAINSGTYTFKNSDGEYELDDMPKDFSGKTWMVTHSITDYNSFIGVSEAQFRAYCNKLSAAGFDGEISFSTIDGATAMMLDATKESDGKFLAISLLYNSSSGMLDVLYTNDSDFFS